MKRLITSRVVQTTCVLACVAAPILAFAFVARLGQRLMPHYVDTLPGQPLPALTRFVLGVTTGEHSLVSLIACFFLITLWPVMAFSKSEGNPASVLAFVSLMWAVALVGLGIAMFSFFLPLSISRDGTSSRPRVESVLKEMAADRETTREGPMKRAFESRRSANGNSGLPLKQAPLLKKAKIVEGNVRLKAHL